MNKKPYSQIMDSVAGDYVPNDLNLAPGIIARIQKGKGFRMQPKLKLVSAILVVVIAVIALFYTVPAVSAAIGRWFGYVPGVGLVREGQIRILAEPVSVTRDGVTVTVDQVILNQERTALLYSVDGIPSDALIFKQIDTICPYKVALQLPTGDPLLATPNGVQSWAAGYQHRFNYQAIPADVNDATLVISCLFHARPGAAPENWEIPLHFVVAPPEMTAFPVIEIPTATAPAATATTAAPPAAEPATEETLASTAPAPATVTLTLDRAVQMDDGYLLYATLNWKDTPYTMVDVADAMQTMHLLDASGQEIVYEQRYTDEQAGIKWDERLTVIAIKTAPIQAPGPLTLVLDSVYVDLPVEASFVFDPGPNPQAGQKWELNQEVTIGEHRLRVVSVTANIYSNYSSYTFDITSDNRIYSATLMDFDNPAPAGGGGGGGGSYSKTFSADINYDGKLPDGPVTVSVTSISVHHVQKLEVQWTPPAVSTVRQPTQPAACLTASAWKSALALPPTLPEGLTGSVLSYGPADSNNVSGAWEVAVTSLDGTQHLTIPGARDGAFSPDGKKLAYSNAGGIAIKNLASGEVSPVAGTADGDFNPVWSPEGKKIVFMRGMGVFDLFITNPDGSDMRQLTHGGVQEWQAGWLSEDVMLYTVPGREDEYTIYRLDLQSGESQEYSTDNVSSVSPDGKHLLTMARTFGDRFLVNISDVDGSNPWLLGGSDLWILSNLWSKDGEWLLSSVSDTDTASTVGALINLRTCEVIALPYLKGSFYSWQQ